MPKATGMASTDKTWSEKAPFSKSDFQTLFRNTNEIDEYELKLIHGKLPDALCGTYFLNGPGMYSLKGRNMHPFDGHGFIRRFTFHGGSEKPGGNRVTFCGRFVETESYKRESKAGRLVYRGLGTLPYPGTLFNIPWNLFSPGEKNVANTCVLPVDDRLLCLWEGGRPHAVNADTLRSTEIFTSNGALKESERFLAHTRWDAKRERYVGMSISDGRDTVMSFMEFDKHMKHLSTVKHILKGKMSFTHDFLITENYYCVVLPPIGIHYLAALKGLLCWNALVIEALYPDTNARTLIHLIPRSCAHKQAREVRTALDFAFQPVHHACAHEVTSATGGTRVELWTSGFEGGFQLGNEFGYQFDAGDWDPRRQNGGRSDKQRLSRITVPVPPPDAPAPDGVGKAEIELIRLKQCIGIDFLEVHPDRDGLPCEFVYASAQSAENEGLIGFNKVMKFHTATQKVESHFVGAHRFTGEPIFVPDRTVADAAEDSGWLLSIVHDGKAEQTELHVLNAQNIEAGPVAVLRLRDVLPLGFHGVWTDRVYPSASAFVSGGPKPMSKL